MTTTYNTNAPSGVQLSGGQVSQDAQVDQVDPVIEQLLAEAAESPDDQILEQAPEQTFNQTFEQSLDEPDDVDGGDNVFREAEREPSPEEASLGLFLGAHRSNGFAETAEAKALAAEYATTDTIAAAAADTTVEDDTDAMMAAANSENATLQDFEDALIEEEIDLLADAETQQKQAQAVSAPAAPTAKELLNLLTNKKTATQLAKEEAAAKKARKEKEEAAAKKAKEEHDERVRAADEQMTRDIEAARARGTGPQDAPTDMGPFRHLQTQPPDVDGDGIPDYQDPHPLNLSEPPNDPTPATLNLDSPHPDATDGHVENSQSEKEPLDFSDVDTGSPSPGKGSGFFNKFLKSGADLGAGRGADRGGRGKLKEKFGFR